MKIAIVSICKYSFGGGVSVVNKYLYEELSKSNDVEYVSLFDNVNDINHYDNQCTVISNKKYKHINKLVNLSDVFNTIDLSLPIFNLDAKKKINKKLNKFDFVLLSDPFLIPYVDKIDVFMVHSDLSVSNMYVKLVKMYLNLYNKKIKKILYSNSNDKKYLSKFKNIKIDIVYNYSNIKQVSYNPNHNKKILYFGRVDSNKNCLETAKLFNDNNIEFDIFGKLDGVEGKDFLELNNVKIYDENYNIDDKIDIFSKYAAYVLPSIYEGQSITILEAKKLGLPIIINKKLEGTHHRISNYIIDVNEIDKIKSLINNDKYREEVYLEQSKDDYKYDIKEIIEKILN